MALRILLAALAAALLAAPTAAAHDLQRHFDEAGTVGTMVVRTGKETIVVGDRRSRQRYLPSSTFKIPNSLVAIDRGVASGADQPYPGPNPNFLVDGRPFLPAACEGDLTLATAFAFSCIPIYQRIARELGQQPSQRMTTVQLVRPVGGDEQDPLRRHAARQERERRARRVVGPVQATLVSGSLRSALKLARS